MRRQVRSPEVVVIAIKLRHILLVLAAMILPLGVLSLAQSVSASLSPAQSVGPSVLFPAETVGPSWPYEKVLNGQHPVIPLKNQAMITRTEHGYLYRAGQQDSHFVITRVESGLRFRDSGTWEWKSIPDGCRREQVAVGVAAVCPVPSSIGLSNPMLLEVWPRLGDDFVDGSTLPGPFQMAVLADAGRDVVLLGAGHDFVNGAMDNDVVRGGGATTGSGRESATTTSRAARAATSSWAPTGTTSCGAATATTASTGVRETTVPCGAATATTASTGVRETTAPCEATTATTASTGVRETTGSTPTTPRPTS
ncbi:MAG: hypothetical protein WKF73_12305 [Nocardioidaceae bacterium]